MSKSKKEQDQKDNVLSEGLARFETCKEAFSTPYEQGESDQNFLHGIGQWDERDIKARNEQRRPALVLNQLLPYAHQVVNDIRQARIAIRVTPVDNKGDIDTSEKFAGVIRNIERQSKANDAYEMGVMNAVGSGYGWLVVRTQYCHEMSFEQEAYIDRVVNFASVYLDPNSTELDGSDAEYGFIFDDISKEDFERRFPDAEMSGFENGANAWVSDNTVRIAEYYYKEYEEREIIQATITLDDGKEKDGILTKEEYDVLVEQGAQIEEHDRRKTEFVTVKHALLTGDAVLEESEWVGKDIPIVPIYGEEVWVDGRRESHSLIRQAKDAQRMYNYWKTASTEFIALQQKAPYIGAVGSFDSRADQWASANTENLPYLEYDVIHDENSQRVEPPQKQPPITGSQGMMQEAMQARDDIRLGLGMPNANMGQQGNEVSGIAIRNRQIEGDNATFHVISNLSASITRVGNILVDIIPKIYSDRKVMRIIGEDDKEETIPVNTPYKKTEDGKLEATDDMNDNDGTYDFSVGKYDVVVDVGASYSSKRQETADKLIELVRAKPEFAELSGDILFDVLDIPRGKELAKRFESMLPPEMLSDDPNAERLKQVLQQSKQMEEQLLNMESALADKSKNTQFEQQKELQEIDLKRQELAIEAKKTEADIMKLNSETALNVSKVQESESNMANLVAQVQELTDAMDIQLAMQEEEQETSEPAIEDITQEETR